MSTIQSSYQESEKIVNQMIEDKKLEALIKNYMNSYCLFGHDILGNCIMIKKFKTDLELSGLISAIPDIEDFLNDRGTETQETEEV